MVADALTVHAVRVKDGIYAPIADGAVPVRRVDERGRFRARQVDGLRLGLSTFETAASEASQ